MDDSIFSEIIDLKSTHEIWIYLNEKYGVVSNDDDDEPMLEVHEDVQHSHNSVIVEDCSTSWSSVDDDHTTTRSLDKIDIDGPSSSDVIDVSTASTLDDDDSCSSYESDVSTSSSTSPHCFISHGDTNVSIGNVVIDCDDPNFELVCRLTNHLRNEMAKTSKLKKIKTYL
jgi:hypothetical protein